MNDTEIMTSPQPAGSQHHRATQRDRETPAAYWLLCEYAAVWVEYDLAALPDCRQSTDEESYSEAVQKLLDESTPTYRTDKRPTWRLKHRPRRETLKQLASEKRLQAVSERNPSSYPSVLQTMLDTYIQGTAAPLAAQTLEQLETTVQVVDWLQDCDLDLPSQDQIRQRIAQERLIKPFYFLVGDNFHNRTDELQRLRHYVGGLETDESPLLIYGPGGIGKSTLIAKFILDHTQLATGQRMPYVYIDCNRRDVDIQEPVLLLLEATRQLAIQYPQEEKVWASLDANLRRYMHERDWDEQLNAEQQGTRHEPKQDMRQTLTQVFATISFGRRQWKRYMRLFVQTISSVIGPHQPLLFVLDTIEELFYDQLDVMGELWSFLAYCHSELPALRIIFSGRSPLPEAFPTQSIQLTGLEPEIATELLFSHGIPTNRLANQIIEMTGHSPLSLRLAADFYHQKQDEQASVERPQSSQDYLNQVQQHVLKGQLHQRLLGHIHDRRIRTLLSPSIVLRRITPDLILRVLAGVCDLQIEDIHEAQQLFDELRRESAFIDINQSHLNVLVPRTELRVMMLTYLSQDNPEMVTQVHERAADYFTTRPEPDRQDRANEVYHRLALGESSIFLDAYDDRTVQQIARVLGQDMEDFPPQAQAYLASRVEISPQRKPNEWTHDELRLWEVITKRQVDNLINLERLQDALDKLSERHDRTVGSPLYPLHIRVLIGLNRMDEAQQVLEKAIRQAPPNTLAELTLQRLATHLNEDRQPLMLAIATYRHALSIAKALGNDIFILNIQLNILRLTRTQFAYNSPEATQAYAELLQVWDEITDEILIETPMLVRDVVAQIGTESAKVIKRAIALVGLTDHPPVSFRPLARAIAYWDASRSRTLNKKDGLLAQWPAAVWKNNLYQTWLTLLQENEWREIVGWLSSEIGKDEDQDGQRMFRPTIMNSALVDLLKARLLLTGRQATLLHDVLVGSLTANELNHILDKHFQTALTDISYADTFSEQAEDVISWAESHDLILPLLQALTVACPDHAALASLLHELGIDGQFHVPSTTDNHHQAQLNSLVQCSSAVCLGELISQEGTDNRYFTAFLVAPDLVLTTYHAVDVLIQGYMSPRAATFRFDRVATETNIILSQGEAYPLAVGRRQDRPWLVAYDETLNYALLRLSNAAGMESCRGLSEGHARGWLTLAEVSMLKTGDDLDIIFMGHGGRRTTLSQENAVVEQTETRCIHPFSTGPSASGAPILDVTQTVAGLHDTSVENSEGNYGTAVFIPAIVTDLQQKKLWPLA
ncbi:MAG: trypsin-like peptidase domain-containing protein [Chloroflexota bacterium]